MSIDFDADSQLTNWQSTRKHAMAGMKNGQMQTAQDAQQAWHDWIDDRMKMAINDCDPSPLGEALHAIQDRHAKGHQFQPWGGGLPSLDHLIADANPDVMEWVQAILDSRGLIKQFAAKCCCKE